MEKAPARTVHVESPTLRGSQALLVIPEKSERTDWVDGGSGIASSESQSGTSRGFEITVRLPPVVTSPFFCSMRAPPCIFFPGEPVEMVADLRSFHNRDLPQLVDVFRQHHGLAGHCADVSAAQFEQAILSRSFFDPDTLVVASQPGSSHPGSSKPGSSDCDTVLGWCQFGPLADRDSDSQESVLAALLLFGHV